MSPMLASDRAHVKHVLQSHAHPLRADMRDMSTYDPIMDAIGNAQVVLIGDGSHGTYEFYAHRAHLTHRLITEKGFTAIALEADWPDTFRINRYIHGCGTGVREEGITDAMDSLREFERFPKWMWKNEVMLPFVRWLREHNDEVIRKTSDAYKRVSVYGMDIYSLHRSAEVVIRYLEKVDPEGARVTKKNYNCFEQFGEDTSTYALAAQLGFAKTCEKEVTQALVDLVRNSHAYRDALKPVPGCHPGEEQFMAQMNALVVRDAEEYYRTMMSEDVRSWNLRDDHFARAVQLIRRHLLREEPHEDGPRQEAKIVLWAHNSHVGDARATDMGIRRGEINVGQLMREIYGTDNVFTVGFLTDTGTVTAADAWDEPPRLFKLRTPMDDSIEKLCSENKCSDKIIITKKIVQTKDGQNRKVEVDSDLTRILNVPRLQRFIGVIYKPMMERLSHYSRCSVAEQFDAVATLAKSRGIQPLEKEDTWHGLMRGEADLTFPFGL